MLGARHPWGKRHATVDLSILTCTKPRLGNNSSGRCSTGPRTVIIHLDLDVSARVTGRVETEQDELSNSCRTTSQTSINQEDPLDHDAGRVVRRRQPGDWRVLRL